MNLEEFIDMLEAAEDGRPFRVSFRLLSGLDDKPSLEELAEAAGGLDRLRHFMEEVANAGPPVYGEVPMVEHNKEGKN